MREITIDKDKENQKLQTELEKLRKEINYQKTLIQALENQTDQGENELRQQLTQLEHIFKTLPVGFCYMDIDFRYLYINQFLANLNGAPIDKHIGRTLKDMAPDIFPKVEKAYHQVQTSGTQQSSIIDITNPKTGEPQIWLADIYPVFSEEGTIKGFNTLVQDITLQKEKENRLKQSEEKYRSLIEDLTEFIVRILTDGTVIWANKIFSKYLETPHDKIAGFSILPHIFEDDRTYVQEAFARMSLENPTALIEFRVQKKESKEVRWNQWHNRLLIAETGEIVGMIGVGRDITESKQLTNQLLQTKKMEALGTLAGGIAHDFNNILAAILGNAEMLKFELSQKTQEQPYLESIINGGERAAKLIKQILTFSRMEIAHFVPTNLVSIIKDTLKMAHSILPNNIEFQHYLKNDCSSIMADSTQIHQILINLFTNAAHAMEDTGGILRITLDELRKSECDLCASQNQDPNSTCLKLTVEDTGTGIALENLEKVFDPFFTTKDVGKGTGLGLSVVHGIVKNHHGQIDIQSRKGVGTCIYIFFPTISDISTEADLLHKSETNDMFVLAPNYILIVEDDPELAKMYQRFLEKNGYPVDMCHDGSEALTLFKAAPEKYFLVITDLIMPYVTGTQLVQQLKSIRPNIPVILSTGYTDELSTEEAKQLGVYRYLMKPYDLNDLKKACDECQRIKLT